jgi:DNA-binding SARP family transcriptional activator
MGIGPCGMVCALCRQFLDGRCAGCVRGDLCEADRAAASPCVVLRCAAGRSVPYCMRDCPEFPCDHYEFGQLFCQTRAATHERRLPYAVTESTVTATDPAGGVRTSHGTAQLRLYTLGRFRVFAGEREIGDVDWSQGRGPTEKVKALLAFLVVRNSQGARRDTLLELLWPEQGDATRAASNLHVAVHSLRRALEPDRPVGTESRFIRFDGLRYRFAGHDVCWVDAVDFEHHCASAAAAEECGDSATAVEQSAMATALYGGDYLTGLSATYTEDCFTDWCMSRREDLREQYLAALVRLADGHVRLDDPDTGLRLARQALQVDPLCERAHRIAMQCLIATGQIALALVQYRVCTSQLARSEGRPPSFETRRLYETVTAVAEQCAGSNSQPSHPG